ncbi:dihydroorotate dehydrogenase [Thermogladius sp. KZ2Tp1]|uniref:dihydroorotate dehydrogenase n=1 Tax=Thermogladius sp. KZ2Tp1 TaxID=3136289 RepID=UPI003DA952BB
MGVKLSVRIAGLTLKNPVMNASGTYDPVAYELFVDPGQLGAVVLKSVTLEPREGNPPPRIHEVPCGLLNSIGIPSVGAKAFVEEKAPALKKYRDAVFIASVAGFTPSEYATVIEVLETAGDLIRAYEVNLSCPNLEKGGRSCALSEDCIREATRLAASKTNKPVIVKLAPDVTDIAAMGKAAVESGADALTVGNTYRAMAVDLKTRRPVFANVVAGYSGPAIKPLTLRAVYETVRAVDVPVIASGGVMTAEDALEYLLVGAKAVQVGTANFVDPRAMLEVVRGIEKFLEENGIDDVNKFINSLVTE